MIETTLVCDNCGRTSKLASHTQFSKLNVADLKIKDGWKIIKIESHYYLLCKKCERSWKQVEKEFIGKGRKKFFKK